MGVSFGGFQRGEGAGRYCVSWEGRGGEGRGVSDGDYNDDDDGSDDTNVFFVLVILSFYVLKDDYLDR